MKEMRKKSGLTQVDLAILLDKPQSYVSKYESGERRLDLIEIREVCIKCDTSLEDFSSQLEVLLNNIKS